MIVTGINILGILKRIANSLPLFIISACSASIIGAILVGFMVDSISLLMGYPVSNPLNPVEELSVFNVLLLVLILPLLETWLFHFLLIKWFQKLTSTNYTLLFSAIFFATVHYQSVNAFVHAGFMGLILSYSFIHWQYRIRFPFLVPLTIHCFRNLVSLVAYLVIGANNS